MAKNKQKKFDENATFSHVFQVPAWENLEQDFFLKGNWDQNYFKNSQDIILELGCGKGEYTVGLRKKYPDFNYLGLDIKGARIWRGAKTVQEENLNNVAFLRTRVEFLDRFFAPEEVAQIWITFADPQPKIEKKRLTSDRFLAIYQKILKKNGIVHLKTDSDLLFEYTLEQIQKFGAKLLEKWIDVHNVVLPEKQAELLSIRTHYENLFATTQSIKYLSFCFEK